jgi:hypothetical protein
MTTVNIMSEMKIAHKRYLGVWNLCSVQWYLMSQLLSSVSKCISTYGRVRAGKSCCWQYQVAKENKFRHRHCYALNVTSPSSPLPHRLGFECLFPGVGHIWVDGGGTLASGSYPEAVGPQRHIFEVYGYPHHILSLPFPSHPTLWPP